MPGRLGANLKGGLGGIVMKRASRPRRRNRSMGAEHSGYRLLPGTTRDDAREVDKLGSAFRGDARTAYISSASNNPFRDNYLDPRSAFDVFFIAPQTASASDAIRDPWRSFTCRL